MMESTTVFFNFRKKQIMGSFIGFLCVSGVSVAALILDLLISMRPIRDIDGNNQALRGTNTA